MQVHLVRARSARAINSCYPNPGIATIASVLRDNHDVEIHDLNVEEYENYVDQVERKKPGVIGFTSAIDDFGDVLRLSERCKRASPSSRIVVGGPHASLLEESVLSLTDAIDALVYGEGELAVKDLLEAFARRGEPLNVKGILYPTKEGPRRSEPTTLSSLDLSPRPSWDLYNLGDFFPLLPVETSRGCPYSCSYCAEGMLFTNKVRRKSPDIVVDELRRNVQEFGVRTFRFADSTFNYTKKRFIELCQAIISTKLDVQWGAYARFETMDEDMMIPHAPPAPFVFVNMHALKPWTRI